MRGVRYTPEQRAEVLKVLDSLGGHYLKAQEATGVTEQTIRRWDKARKRKAAGLELPKPKGKERSAEWIRDERRARVAYYRRRGYTYDRIVEAMADDGFINPRTGKPWTRQAIYADAQFLREQARDAAMRDISEHRAELLDHLSELLHLAWKEQRYDDARKVIKDMREMLGTDAPQVIVFEQMQQRMTEAVASLERAFADDPATLQRALDALMGVDHPSAQGLN